MTTIATDGRSMAGDGARFRNDTMVARNAAKVHRMPDGGLVGCSGKTTDCIAFRDWVAAGCQGARPKASELSALHLKPTGELIYFNERGAGVAAELPAAIGSGTDLALGALDAGASPAQAVEIAMRRDPYSGGTVLALALHPEKDT